MTNLNIYINYILDLHKGRIKNKKDFIYAYRMHYKYLLE